MAAFYSFSKEYFTIHNLAIYDKIECVEDGQQYNIVGFKNDQETILFSSKDEEIIDREFEEIRKMLLNID